MVDRFSFEPIGTIVSPFLERNDAPRQPVVARGVEAQIVLRSDLNLEHAIMDLGEWSHIWVVFCFHKNTGWRPKVQPPRSTERRGVFATRSPYRPNPIGISAVELVRTEGLTLHIRNVDMLDGSPVLDIKPYVAYCDAITSADAGWLAPDDPVQGYAVRQSENAKAQLTWLRQLHGLDLWPGISEVLVLGAEPHAYRRIQRDGDRGRLSIKDWRVFFKVEDRDIVVAAIGTGYRPKAIATEQGPTIAVHRAFVEQFGWDEGI